MYRPSELHAFLNRLQTGPKKSLSQNFLIDGNIIRKIVDAASPTQDSTVLEIGPGPGALTEELLKRNVKVIAVELDRTLAEHLERLDPEKKQLTVINEDILKVSLQDQQIDKVIANLPYHITTAVVTKLLTEHEHLSEIIVMVQEEVAKRFTAKPGSKAYGSITVFLNYYSQPEYLFKVGAGCFHPKPKVDSAIIRLKRRPPPVALDPEPFFSLVREAFSQRRKTLAASLKKRANPNTVREFLREIGKTEKARPEELSLEEWARLYQLWKINS